MNIIEDNFVSFKEAHTTYKDWYNIFTVIYERKRITTINGIKIYIYPNEDSEKHKSPHLHAYYQNQSITVDLTTFEATGNLPFSQQKKALEWIHNNKQLLYENWNKLNSGIQLPVI